jgi:MoaA/NifB/PqqE/SkfB family radical SAM enzyme
MLLHAQQGLKRNWLHVFTTLRCNLCCPYCSVATGGRNTTSGTQFEEIGAAQWGQIFAKTGCHVLFGGGEPFLHAEAMEILWAIPPERRIQLFTNGLVVTDDHIRSLGARAKAAEAAGGWLIADFSYHPPGDVERFADRVLKVRALGVRGCQTAVQPAAKRQRQHLRAMKARLQELGVSFNIRGNAYDNLAGVCRFDDPPDRVFCRRRHTVVAPDGHRYPCIWHMLAGVGVMEDLVHEDVGPWEQIHTCHNYGKCTVCDLDRYCKIATRLEEVEGPITRKDFGGR